MANGRRRLATGLPKPRLQHRNQLSGRLHRHPGQKPPAIWRRRHGRLRKRPCFAASYARHCGRIRGHRLPPKNSFGRDFLPLERGRYPQPKHDPFPGERHLHRHRYQCRGLYQYGFHGDDSLPLSGRYALCGQQRSGLRYGQLMGDGLQNPGRGIGGRLALPRCQPHRSGQGNLSSEQAPLHAPRLSAPCVWRFYHLPLAQRRGPRGRLSQRGRGTKPCGPTHHPERQSGFGAALHPRRRQHTTRRV